MKAGEKYLAGDVELGLLGKQRVLVLPNERKEKSSHPDHYIYVKSSDGELIKVGALWNNTKKKMDSVNVEERGVVT